LQASKNSLNPQTHLVPHGVDVDHFAKATDPATRVPDDVADLPHPILGFFGLIQEWVDLELLAEVARLRPDGSIVLIGQARTDRKPRDMPKNVHFLGQRPYETLPAYCRAFDVGLIPFRINELTLNVNPIKLREYLAAGLPVVSTPLPEVAVYRPLVDIAEDAEAFVAACDRAVAADDSESIERRRDAMRKETWAAKVEHLSKLVEACRATR
jgi:glycosyltransferase involved in cell wall biosynthesis